MRNRSRLEICREGRGDTRMLTLDRLRAYLFKLSVLGILDFDSACTEAYRFESTSKCFGELKMKLPINKPNIFWNSENEEISAVVGKT